MNRSNKVWAVVMLAAVLVVAGCGSGVSEESASGGDFDTSTGAGTDTSASDSSGTDAALIAEVDALCATTVDTMDGIADALAVPVSELAELSAAMFDVNDDINTLITAYDAIEASDPEAAAALNDIAAFLAEFSALIFDVGISAGAEDLQATSDAIDALVPPDATAAEAGFQLFADQGATNCQVLAG